VDMAVFPGQQGGPLVHIIAAKAVAFREALQPDFAAYARQIVANAQALAAALAEGGWRIISGGTDNHVMLVDVFSKGSWVRRRNCAGQGGDYGKQERDSL